MLSQPLVSVIILNYNGESLLPYCIKSLMDQDYNNLEIIVADNGSIDHSRAVAKSYGVKFLAMGANLGFSKANNKAAKIAKGELLFLVNNDMYFDKKCVSELVKEIAYSSDIFATDPLQLAWDDNGVIHGVTTLKRGGIKTWMPFVEVDFVSGKTGRACVPWGCAGSLMVRRDMFLELGGFDEEFFIDFEDVDTCWRAWMRGWKTVFVPTAIVYHKVGESSSRVRDEPYWRWLSAERNLQRFLLKVMSKRTALKALSAKFFQSLALLLKGDYIRFTVIWRAMWWNLLNLPDTLQERRKTMHSSILEEKDLIRFFLK